MADEDRASESSFFGANFTKIDWVVLITILGFFVGSAWFVVSQEIELETAKLRADFIILKDDLEDLHEGTQDHLTRAEQDLLTAFDSLATQVEATFARAMDERTDELGERLLALFEGQKGLTVTVVNIPRFESQAIILVDDFQQKFGFATKMYPVGDKLVLETVLQSLSGDKFSALVSTLETLEVSYPGIETNITWLPGSKTLELLQGQQ